MTGNTRPSDGVLRRTIVKAGAVGAGALVLGGAATASEGGLVPDQASSSNEAAEEDAAGDEAPGDEPEVDEPVGFEGEVLAPHAPFLDDVTVTFHLTFADEHDGDPIVVELDDASTTAVLEVRWEPGGTVGWHTHPGPVIVNIVDGELELVWERDCVPRTYAAGETFFDPSGEIHTATNPSDTEETVAYATFLGVPDGAPLTEHVAPVECNPIEPELPPQVL